MLKRYEMGRCSTCGDCNTNTPQEDTEGTWMKASEVEEFLKEQFGFSLSNNRFVIDNYRPGMSGANL
jgi:hypothetical protein